MQFRKTLFSLSVIVLSTLGVTNLLQAMRKASQEECRDSAPEMQTLTKANEESIFTVYPYTILIQIFSFLSRHELCVVGEVCKAAKKVSEGNFLWRPIYQKVPLMPYAEADNVDNVVTSYKHYILSMKILQAAVRKGKLSEWTLLYSGLSHAFRQQPVLFKFLSLFYTLKKEPQEAQKYANQFRQAFSTQAEFDRAVFFGQYGLDQVSENERFAYLRTQEEKDDLDAQQLVNQALIQGVLGQQMRSPSERREELDRRIKAGDHNALLMVIPTLISGEGLDQEMRSPEERFADLECYSQLRFKGWNFQARCAVVQAIYEGKFGQNKRPEQERYQDLKARAQAGDLSAQSYILAALTQGTLGQSARSEQERFEELCTLDYEYAPSHIFLILLGGRLGQGSRPLQERIQQLEELIRQPKFQIIGCARLFVDKIFEGKDFGQEAVPENIRFQHLERLANLGVKEAEDMLLYAIAQGKLGMNVRNPEERFAELERKAQTGSILAAQEVVNILILGTLGQSKRSADERYHKLESYAVNGSLKVQEHLLYIVQCGGFTNRQKPHHLLKVGRMMDPIQVDTKNDKLSPELLLSLRQRLAAQGHVEARQWLNQILYEGTYGQNCHTPQNRFALLNERALNGDKNAERLVVQALMKGELGQGALLGHTRFNALVYWAEQGNREAQQEIVSALSHGHLEQSLVSDEERVAHLRRLVDQNNTYAASELVDILVRGRLGQWHSFPHARWDEIVHLSDRGYQSAQNTLVVLLTEGIDGFFDDIQGNDQWGRQWLGQDQRSEQERFEDLKRRALTGNIPARFAVINAIFQGRLGQDQEACVQNLLPWLALGEKQAFQYIQMHAQKYSQNSPFQMHIQEIEKLYHFLYSMNAPNQMVWLS